MLVGKISGRVKEALKHIIIRNKRYKPKGFYLTIADYTLAEPKAESVEVFPGYTSHLRVDEDFKNRFVKYVNTTEVAQIPPSQVVKIPGGRVFTDNNVLVSIISGNNKLIGDVSFDLHNDDIAKSRIFNLTYFKEPQKYSGTVFSMLIGRGGIVNYAHWLNDSVTRIALLKRSGWYDSIDWFLVPSMRYDFHRDGMKFLGIDESKVISGEEVSHVQADTLIATTFTRHSEHIPEWSVDFQRDVFLKFKTPENQLKKKIPYVYISRNDATKRRVLNENELMNTLGKYGFESFELASLSFEEKITLFANADVVIATIGAGQANLVFCKKGTHVIELMAEDFAQPMFNDLANKVGLKYEYLICKSDAKAKNFKQGERLNMIVNITEIERRLQRIFATLKPE